MFQVGEFFVGENRNHARFEGTAVEIDARNRVIVLEDAKGERVPFHFVQVMRAGTAGIRDHLESLIDKSSLEDVVSILRDICAERRSALLDAFIAAGESGEDTAESSAWQNTQRLLNEAVRKARGI